MNKRPKLLKQHHYIMTLALILTAFLTLLLIASCATNMKPVGDYCLNTSVILVSRKDVLTPQTEREILKANETREALCPPSGH